MSEVPAGIFNPFKPKPKKKQGIQALDQRKTESGILIEPAVTFDGDSYVLKFDGITNVPEAVERLTELLRTVNIEHQDTLHLNGIAVIDHPNSPDPNASDMILKGPKCTISVYVGEPPHTEVMAYRRIAFVLKKLSIGPILKKYRATVNERG